MTTAQKDFINKMRDLTSGLDFGGILPSLVISQAILESNWGKSGLASKGNALFGIKATNTWQGAVYNANTKECYDGINMVTVPGSFRAYNNWAESIADYIALVSSAKRYQAVIGETCFRTACRAIHAAGYATDPNYADKLIQMIYSYSLISFDPVIGRMDISGTVKVRLDGALYRAKANNIGGNWFIPIPGLEIASIPLRDMLKIAGFIDITWDEASETVSAYSAPRGVRAFE